MTRSHRIRLHAAWKRLEGSSPIGPSDVTTRPEPPVEQAAEFVPEASVSLPDLRLRNCVAPWVTYCRRFNRPTGIGSRDKIWVACGLFDFATRVTLNGQELSAGQRLEITDMLRPHNELRIVIPAESFARASLAATAELSIEAEA